MPHTSTHHRLLVLAALAACACHHAPPAPTAEPQPVEDELAPRSETPAAEDTPAARQAAAAAEHSTPPTADAKGDSAKGHRVADARPHAAAARRSPAKAKRAHGVDDLLSGALGTMREAAGGTLGLGTIGHGFSGTMPAAAPLQIARPAGPIAASGDFDTEAYAHVRDNPFLNVGDDPLSTFSIDVDTASYSNLRRFLRDGQRPPIDAVRIEELVNYFRYDDPTPRGDVPFSVRTELAAAPWNAEHKLVRIALRARSIDAADVPPRNLVFLVDVSGSMQSPDKLPLLQHGLALLARNLRPQDRLAIAVYAGASGLALPPTSGDDQGRILDTLASLEAGGSTNGAEGIELAYELAERSFVEGGINRVILATDGDFNVGTTSHGELVRLVEEKRKSGVFLTVLGFGTGNLEDSTMEALADHGNGNYAYVDSPAEARKVLVREAGSTLVTVAKDVKLQVEFNPARVASYRLVGYENRMLAARDFNDDTKDAGEIGAGHGVTALYEIVPTAAASPTRTDVDPLRYQTERAPSTAAESDEWLTVKLRYKEPSGATSRLLRHVVREPSDVRAPTSDDFRWSAAVAAFGMVLRESEHRGKASLALVEGLARSALGIDPHGDRRELLDLVERARTIGLGRDG